MAQPTLPAVWAGVQAALQVAAGVPVIWKWQSAPQPALDYVAISLGGYVTDGIDFVVEQPAPAWAASTDYAEGARVLNDSLKTYACITAGTSAGAGGPTGTGSGIADGSCVWDFVPPGAEVALVLSGIREFALQIEVFSASVVEQVAAPTALSLCDALVSKLRLPTARDALAAVTVVPFGPGPVQWVPALVAVNFRGRASCDVRCRTVARAITEYTAFIASLGMELHAHGGGSLITLPIDVP